MATAEWVCYAAASSAARSAAERALLGVWGRSPQRGPGAEPLAGARGRSPRKILHNKTSQNASEAIRNSKIKEIKAPKYGKFTQFLYFLISKMICAESLCDEKCRN